MYCIRRAYCAVGRGGGLSRIQPLRETEVDQFDRPEIAGVLQHDVFELDVAVVDVEGVQVDQRRRELSEDLARVFFCEPQAVLRAL